MRLKDAEKRVLQRYFTGKPVKRAFLFGSYARNEGNLDSDIDILVELDYSEPIGMKFFIYHNELEELLQKKVDLVTTDGLNRHVKPLVDKDKVLIYERSSS